MDIKPFKLYFLQQRFRLGDWAGNSKLIVQAAQALQAQGGGCLVTPALALCGGLAVADYLRHSAFLQAGAQALAQLQAASVDWPDVQLVVGHPLAALAEQPPCYNAASVLHQGQVLGQYAQQIILGDSAQARYFAPGSHPLVWNYQGQRLALLMEDDAAHPPTLQAAKAAGAQLLLVLQAQAWSQDLPQRRQQHLSEQARAVGLPMLCVDRVGGQDSWVFVGGSLAVQADGRLAAQAPYGQTACWPVQVQPGNTPEQAPRLVGEIAPTPEPLALLWQALVLAVRDYVDGNRFPGVLLGLSGGIDSALVLAIAVDALGPERVHTIMLPSPYTASISTEDAHTMAEQLGVRYEVMDILPLMQAFDGLLAPHFAGRPQDTTEENLQARSRGALLMALSNKLGGVVLTTSNKSEMATGYCTLYGDMAGGFAVLRDVYKTEVFALARWRNANHPDYALCPSLAQPIIPERIITRPPSAELRPDQADTDSLPDYPVLDGILRLYLEQQADTEQLLAAGYPQPAIEQVLRLLRISEYKRRQAPPGPCISRSAFGLDWQVPMGHGFAG